MDLHEIIGLAGVALMLGAYGLLMTGRLASERALFHLMNLCGALMVLYSLLHDFNLPTFLIEIAWSAVALYGLWKVYKARCAR